MTITPLTRAHNLGRCLRFVIVLVPLALLVGGCSAREAEQVEPAAASFSGPRENAMPLAAVALSIRPVPMSIALRKQIGSEQAVGRRVWTKWKRSPNRFIPL